MRSGGGRPARLRGFRVYAPNGGMFQGDFAATRDAAGKSLFETGLAVPRLRLDAALVDARAAGGRGGARGLAAGAARARQKASGAAPVGDGEPSRRGC